MNYNKFYEYANVFASESTNDRPNLYDMEVWAFIIQLAILLLGILMGNILVRKIGFLKKSLLPAPLIGGMFLMLFQLIPWFGIDELIDTNFMIMATFHLVGIGSVAVALKRPSKSERKREGTKIIRSAIGMVNVHFIQGLIGLAITMFIIFPAAGLLGPIGLGQGSGLAVSIGTVMERFGFENAIDFGLTIVAVGFFVACLGGVLLLKLHRKAGLLPPKDEEADKAANTIELPGKNEIGLTDTADKFTIEFGIVLGLYFAGFILMLLIDHFILSGLSPEAHARFRPILFGLNFVFGIVAASIFKKVMGSLKERKIVEKEYINNFMMTRIAGISFDLMVVAGLATIAFANLTWYFLLIILVICILSGAATFFYLKWMCNKVFPEYSEAILFGMYGKLTGTTGCGMLLLREVDPKLETPAARMLALQSFPATLMGFPLFALIPIAAETGLGGTAIVFGIVLAMFLTFQLIIIKMREKTLAEQMAKKFK